MEQKDGLVKGFSFSAAEFLEEELNEIKEVFGEIDFITQGKYIHNDAKPHKHEWWAPEKACNKLNKLLADRKP